MKALICFILGLTLSSPVLFAVEDSKMGIEIHQPSFRLGSVSSFSEMVRVGVKELALSSAMPPKEMDELEAAIRAIAEKEGISAYREPDLIVTDLFPADVAKGKDVMLLYKGDTLDKYLALKKRKARLESEGKYSGEARRDIAREFGKLLSYPKENIESRLK